ncbi:MULTISPECIES: tyrosine-type recombinase/integrase [Nostoc]|uniref:Tyrosine-type recombinase/integrase n=1 Tax=Nostoc paludosum FACHB-159 TaxID=2692908 RepID=A0ABR8KMV7_9NOSO|nr:MULTISPECIES: tyrosine-type recombinase/integrase [Nostoc]MBD2683058.1 tyrosine-type recombinase/integrase [Nostoc sp. FACHB-857]MBD2739410.1 tyrosine-type recombinase/integrase [Nostoc paludosum FACHB-159]
MARETTRQIDLVLAAPKPLTVHPAAVYLSSLTSGSRRTMEKSLNVIARMLTAPVESDALSLDWSKLRYQHTAAIRSVLMEQYAPATVNRMLCALRRVLQEAHHLGLITTDDYATAINLKSVRGDSPLRGRLLKPSEIAALLNDCKNDLTPIGKRDAALIAILSGSGLRRSEFVALDMVDYKTEDSSLLVRKGKGRKARTVYLPSGAVAALEDWLVERGNAPGALICPVRRGGHIKVGRMTDQAVMTILRKRASCAQVAAFSPHDFRRTFITNLLAAGVDVLTVSRLAGHADPATTAKYDLRSEEFKRQAVQLLHVPYGE